LSIINEIKLKTRLSLFDKPNLYIELYKIFGKRKYLLINKNVEIVIEGFPRSANTYAVVAFEISQKRKVNIAHHLHSPSQILKAIEWNIPTMVLIREPKEAILSFIIRHPEFSLKNAIKYYIHFYSPLLSYKEKIYISEFNNIIKDFGKEVENFNKKFGTTFTPYRKTEENEEKIFKIIDNLNIEQDKGLETQVARPSKLKKEKKEQLKKELEKEKYKDLLLKAKKIYTELTL